MKSTPILFSAPMIRAIRSGIKTQTRRLVKGEALEHCQTKDFHGEFLEDIAARFRPHGGRGDELWVKETFGVMKGSNQIIYRADGGWADAPNIRDMLQGGKWKPSIFMGRAQSRITLEHVTEPRIERLQAITEDDAKAEGALWHDGGGVGHSGFRHDINHGVVYATARASYAALWDAINEAPGTRWNDNPFVWVNAFKEIK